MTQHTATFVTQPQSQTRQTRWKKETRATSSSQQPFTGLTGILLISKMSPNVASELVFFAVTNVLKTGIRNPLHPLIFYLFG